MEMHQLRYFLAAAKTLSFTRAAEICNISQPALTTAIRKLEDQLGSPLFHREGRRLALNEFGRRMQPHLAQIVEQADNAQTVAASFRLLDQVPIRVGVIATVGPARLACFLSSFEQKHPGIDVTVEEGSLSDLQQRLDDDKLDLAILNPLEGIGDRYRAEPLYRERYVVLLPPDHPLGSEPVIGLRDLSEQPYVDRLSCEMRDAVMKVCDDLGIRLYARFRSEREDWVQAMVNARIGFAFFPEYSITQPDALHRPLDPPVERTIALVSVPGRRHSPAVAAFVRAARSYRWPG